MEGGIEGGEEGGKGGRRVVSRGQTLFRRGRDGEREVRREARSSVRRREGGKERGRGKGGKGGREEWNTRECVKEGRRQGVSFLISVCQPSIGL